MGATYSELLAQFQVSSATMSGTLKSLEKAGHISRKKYGSRTFYSITEKGSQALSEFHDEGRAMLRVADLVMQRVEKMGPLKESDRSEIRMIVEDELRSLFANLETRLKDRKK